MGTKSAKISMWGKLSFMLFHITIVLIEVIDVRSTENSIQIPSSGRINVYLDSSKQTGAWSATCKQCFKNINIHLNVSVPGGIYTDLESEKGYFKNKIYEDYNDLETRWVAEANWTYRRQFSSTLQ